MSEGSVTLFFRELRAGDATAARKLWERFMPRLMALARKTLAGRPQRVADADDAVQSAFVSFYRRVERGEFGEALDRDDLWNLLGVITVRKSVKQAQRQATLKRGGGKVLGEDALKAADGSPLPLDALVGPMPAADFDIHCEELMLTLAEELRVFAMLRLLGYQNKEIAGLLDCTERKVERKLQLIRRQWEDEVA
jgi:DNA-directed RNA polymerase specialized sigma24 family protein